MIGMYVVVLLYAVSDVSIFVIAIVDVYSCMYVCIALVWKRTMPSTGVEIINQ